MKRLGNGFIVAAWIGFLALLTIGFSGLFDRQRNPNGLAVADPTATVTQVVLQRNRAGHYLADGFINGHRVTFLLDTGATDVALGESLARRLGLRELGRGISETANGRVAVWYTRLDTVALGPLRQSDVRASVLPSLTGDEVLLGMSFLKHLELVQRGDRLILRGYREG